MSDKNAGIDKNAGAVGPFYVVHYSYIDGNANIKTGRLGIQAKDETEARSLAMAAIKRDPDKKAPLLTKVRLY